jgi:glycosyltransferase involved in cell wall biosynthesis
MQISVVIPLFNESESLPELMAWIDRVMQANQFTYEVIMVDDGSDDNSWQILEQLKGSYASLKAIRFLCEAGASTFYISGAGWDALDEALYYGNMEIVRYLREARKAECLKRTVYNPPKDNEKSKWYTFWKFI